jgi:predicted phosphodiesterase
MRCAIIADIHANLAALSSVLDDIKKRGEIDRIWCLGDIVGYGPDPCQCIELVRRLKALCIAGNHDLAAVGGLSLTEFNPDAAYACRWTRNQLSDMDVAYLKSLPKLIEVGNFTLVHGSPRHPVWEYLLSVSNARESFAYFGTQFCLVGHSHVPSIFRRTETGDCSFNPFSPNIGLALRGSRLIVNPGSVGQPRDGDPRASYAILDDEIGMLRLYRIPYDVSITQARMVKHNLPVRLVSRLGHGI